VLATIPVPGGGCSGLAWAEGTLWVGQYRDRKIHQIDPQTGALLRTIETSRFVTGVIWIGELVLERLAMPSGVGVSGLESDGGVVDNAVDPLLANAAPSWLQSRKRSIILGRGLPLIECVRFRRASGIAGGPAAARVAEWYSRASSGAWMDQLFPRSPRWVAPQ
jgi:hypothetical protein